MKSAIRRMCGVIGRWSASRLAVARLLRPAPMHLSIVDRGDRNGHQRQSYAGAGTLCVTADASHRRCPSPQPSPPERGEGGDHGGGGGGGGGGGTWRILPGKP